MKPKGEWSLFRDNEGVRIQWSVENDGPGQSTVPMSERQAESVLAMIRFSEKTAMSFVDDGKAGFVVDVLKHRGRQGMEHLTIREYISTQALAGMLTHDKRDADDMAKDAVYLADTLLEELSK